MIIRVPNDPMLYNSAYRNIENFIRDIACVPRAGIQPFIRRRKKVYSAIKSYRNPFNPYTYSFDPDFKCTDKYQRYMHIDLGVTKDAVGISMAHVPRVVSRHTIEEKSKKSMQVDLPVVRVDFWGRITVAKGEEIVLADIRELIYELSRRGFYFGLITFDRFQSIDSIQTLRSYGYTCGHFSVDRTSSTLELDRKRRGGNEKPNPLGYNKKSTEGNTMYAMMTLKDLMYDDRLELPATRLDLYDKDWFAEECIQSQEVNGKIDHPTVGTIDVMHSVAGSTTHAIVNEKIFVTTDTEKELNEVQDKLYTSAIERESRIDRFLGTPAYNQDTDPRNL
jgi:hypothetical protein